MSEAYLGTWHFVVSNMVKWRIPALVTQALGYFPALHTKIVGGQYLKGSKLKIISYLMFSF